jgi:hypothetical protein
MKAKTPDNISIEKFIDKNPAASIKGPKWFQVPNGGWWGNHLGDGWDGMGWDERLSALGMRGYRPIA